MKTVLPPKVLSKSSVDWDFRESLADKEKEKQPALFEMLDKQAPKFEEMLDQEPKQKAFSVANYMLKNAGNKKKVKRE